MTLPFTPRTPLRVAPLSSGSRGNCWLIEAEGFRLLMDQGLTLTELAARLHPLGLELKDIDALVFTHQHADHICGAGPFLRRRAIPYWCSTSAHAQALKKEQKIPAPALLHDGVAAEIGPFSVLPVRLPHDADETFAFKISAAGASFAYASDLGFPAPGVLDKLKDATLLAWEFNHDAELLSGFDGYPEPIKARIAGKYGHLSNAQAQTGLETLLHPALLHLWLVHLSEKTNRPALALAAARETLAAGGFSPDLAIAAQHQGGAWVTAE